MPDLSRRGFVGSTVILGAGAISGCHSMENKNEATKVVHHVFFWLKAPADAAMQAQLMEGLKTLKAIPQVQKLMIGRPASTLSRDVVDNSYHVSELMYFNSTEDQDSYQSHPIHKAFVEKCSMLWERVVVYDMLVEE